MINTPYLDHYPCNFYTVGVIEVSVQTVDAMRWGEGCTDTGAAMSRTQVLQDVDALPAILADALRQWYEMTLQL